MNKVFTIRAATLDLAMARAKEQFGRDAIVVDTRNVTRKNPGRMEMRRVVELSVMPTTLVAASSRRPARDDVEIFERPSDSGKKSVAKTRQVQGEIRRIERLIRSVEAAESSLRSFESVHPLHHRLARGGAGEATVRRLMADLENATPAALEADVASSLSHLESRLPCVKSELFGNISGCHVFLGTAGVGKTTLAIKLAAELVRVGKRVAIVEVLPFHSGDVQRVEEAASALMIDAAVTRSHEELVNAMKLYADVDVVLVDTPCPLTRRSAEARDVFDQLAEADMLYKHYVCSLTGGLDFLAAEMDLYERYRCDYLSLARLDLARSPGRLLDVALMSDVKFSFLSYTSPDGSGVEIATPSRLIDLAVGEEDNSKAAAGGEKA